MEKIIDINTTIAQFMGFKVIEYQHGKQNHIYNGNPNAPTIGDQVKLWDGLSLEFTGRFTNAVKYPFNKDFRYLIPVIRKIEEMGYVVLIAGIKYQVYRVMDEANPIVSFVCGDLSKKTEMTCDLIVEFIKWYNIHN